MCLKSFPTGPPVKGLATGNSSRSQYSPCARFYTTPFMDNVTLDSPESPMGRHSYPLLNDSPKSRATKQQGWGPHEPNASARSLTYCSQLPLTGLLQWLADYSPQATFSLPPAFINKILHKLLTIYPPFIMIGLILTALDKGMPPFHKSCI